MLNPFTNKNQSKKKKKNGIVNSRLILTIMIACAWATKVLSKQSVDPNINSNVSLCIKITTCMYNVTIASMHFYS